MYKILLIDDDPTIYKLTKRVLSSVDCCVHWASNGVEALAQLSNEVDLPDLVLCDIAMPGMNGHQTLSAIRQDARLHCLRVVMLTAFSQAEHIQMAEKLGAIGYIVKPFRPQELVEQIKLYLSSPSSGDSSSQQT